MNEQKNEKQKPLCIICEKKETHCRGVCVTCYRQLARKKELYIFPITEKRSSNTLSIEQYIKENPDTNLSELARKYNVSRAWISKIKKRMEREKVEQEQW